MQPTIKCVTKQDYNTYKGVKTWGHLRKKIEGSRSIYFYYGDNR